MKTKIIDMEKIWPHLAVELGINIASVNELDNQLYWNLLYRLTYNHSYVELCNQLEKLQHENSNK